jgi:hypothetical protein
MPVAYIQSGYAVYGVKPGAWKVGEVTRCQLASGSTQRPDQRGDLLLCGGQTLTAWSMSWLRADFKSGIYQNTKVYAVTFRSSGYSSRGGTWWWCRGRLKAFTATRQFPGLGLLESSLEQRSGHRQRDEREDR